jgi:hypothetical protein
MQARTLRAAEERLCPKTIYPNTETMTKPSAKKTTTNRKKKAPRERDVSKIDLPAPEAVTRHALFGACDFALLDPGEGLPEAAREALFDAIKGQWVLCVLQCEGYVFNVVGSLRITFVDHAGDVTGSSPPEMSGGGIAKA